MTTTAPGTTRPVDHREPTTTRVLARTLRAEWARLWSVRTSWLFVLTATIGVVGISLLAGSDARGAGGIVVTLQWTPAVGALVLGAARLLRSDARR